MFDVAERTSGADWLLPFDPGLPNGRYREELPVTGSPRNMPVL
jgi:hypothetical protein